MTDEYCGEGEEGEVEVRAAFVDHEDKAGDEERRPLLRFFTKRDPVELPRFVQTQTNRTHQSAGTAR